MADEVKDEKKPEGEITEGEKKPIDEKKPEEKKPVEEKKPDDKKLDDNKSKAPAKYELKLPDGTSLDAKDVARIEKVARENDWDQETTQAVLEQQHADLVTLSDEFKAETLADKTYGGDKLPETQRLANLVIDTIRPAGHARRDAFLKFLGRAGAGNHIEVVSFMADLGKRLAEDGQLRDKLKEKVEEDDPDPTARQAAKLYGKK